MTTTTITLENDYDCPRLGSRAGPGRRGAVMEPTTYQAAAHVQAQRWTAYAASVKMAAMMAAVAETVVRNVAQAPRRGQVLRTICAARGGRPIETTTNDDRRAAAHRAAWGY